MADIVYGIQVIAEALGFDSIAAAAAKLTGQATGASEGLEQIADAADKANEALGDTSSVTKSMDLGKLKSGFADMGGPIGGIASKLVGMKEGAGKLTETLGGTAGSLAVVATGAAMAAAAIAALLAVVGAAVIGIAAWGVGLANTRRDLDLVYEGLALTDPALAGLGETAASVSKATGVSQDQLQKFAKDLSAAGVSAENMGAALHAVATAEGAVAGAGAGIVDSIKANNGALDEAIAKSNEFGPLLAKKMMSIGAQSDRLKSNISDIFGGLNIEPVLAGMSTLVGIFDSTSSTGQTLKWVFESIFQPLLDAVPAAAVAIEAFVLGVMIGGLKLYIAFKPAINAVKELVASVAGGSDSASWMPSITSFAETMAPALAILVGAFVGIGVAIGAVIGFSVILTAGMYEMVGAVLGAVGGIASAIAGFIGGMLGAGKDLMLGLAKGITEGGAAVLGAITGAVGGAINAAKSMLGIASPSKVFAEIGGQTAEGMAVGVERNVDAPMDAMSAMVEPPTVDAGGGSQTSTTNSGGNSIVININAPSGDAKGIAEAVRIALQDILQGDMIAMGAA